MRVADFALVDADELGLETEEEIDAADLTAKLTPVARSAKTTKGSIKVTTSLDKSDKAIISDLKDAGYTVKFYEESGRLQVRDNKEDDIIHQHHRQERHEILLQGTAKSV